MSAGRSDGVQVFRRPRVFLSVDAAALAREVNDRTYEVLLRFNGREQPDEVLAELLCECGCLGYVALPLSRYADSGAWIDEHRTATT